LKIVVIAAALLALSAPAFAQISATDSVSGLDGYVASKFALPKQDQVYAGIASDITVGLSIGADTIHSWQSPNRKAAFVCQGIRDGAVLGITELLKRLVSRIRPDGSDNMSWPSEHTAFAAASAGGYSYAFVIPITIGTGAGRIMANKHYLTDVVSGALIGGVIGRYTRFCK
jgi:membrane-associated phospholipid phosphatase